MPGPCCLDCRGSAWPPRSGQAESVCGQPGPLTGRLRQGRRRRCRWRGGRGCRGPDLVNSACEAASWTSRSGTPASSAAVMNACRKVCGPTGFADPGAAGHSPDDPGGAVPVQPLPVRAAEDRPVHALADSQVDCPRGAGRELDGDHLAALASNHQGAVTALDTQGLDVGAGGLGDPQPVERQQRDQRVLAWRPSPAATSSAPSSLRSSPVACES